jgi:diguanylate cyclase (GGDEF)-like protein
MDEATLDARLQVCDRREKAMDRREQALNRRGEDAQAQVLSQERTLARSSEANSLLVEAVVVFQNRTEAAEQATQEMSFLAGHDPLTDLPNRAHMADRLSMLLAAARGQGQKIALLYLDLDHFKTINDTLGHTVGDRLLQSTAQRLRSCVRQSDMVCRQGGDEFIILMPDVKDIQVALRIARKLIEAMGRPHVIGHHRLKVTLSVGISLYPDSGLDAETLIGNADKAMYFAKHQGRNQCRVFAAS